MIQYFETASRFTFEKRSMTGTLLGPYISSEHTKQTFTDVSFFRVAEKGTHCTLGLDT